MSVDQSEIDAALLAVRRATVLTATAQRRLVSGDTLVKDDNSPVTVADFGAQAIVCATLTERLGNVAVVGEEDSNDLARQPELLRSVTDLVSSSSNGDVQPEQVLDAIAIGGAAADGDRYWTLDPIDGTKGYLRGDQYAIALALIEHGKVVLGVLGCPNLPQPEGSPGALFVAVDGATHCYLADDPTPRLVKTADPRSLADARFCESVESSHSDQGRSAAIAERLDITREPYRIDSQCKYAAVARGDASIYLRLPTNVEYVEKIWDHAAGMFVVEQAGGVVTDTNGAPLDFSHGRLLGANVGVVATSGRFHDEVVAAVRAVL